MKIRLIFLFSFLSCCGLQSQVFTDLHFDTYGTEYVKIQRGLSQNSVMCMIEDRNGFLWIGTWDGLNRFDGYDFTIYKPGVSTNISNISNETVNALFEDEDGQIWVGTDEGLNMFNPSEMIFEVFIQKTFAGTSYGENRIYEIAEGVRGKIWVGTANGLYVFCKQTKEFEFIPFPKDRLMKKQPMITSIFRSYDKKKMYVGSSIGLYEFDINTYIFREIPNLEIESRSKSINVVFEDSHKNLWVGTELGLFLRKNKTQEFLKIHSLNSELESNHVLSIMEDIEGNIWIGTMGGGVVLYVSKNEKFEVFGNPDQLYGGMTNNYVYSLLQTRNGSIWVGTWRGLNKFTPDQFRFNHISFGQGPFFLNSNMVWSFLEIDKSYVWVGTENGINVYGLLHNKIYQISKNSGHPLKLMSDKIRAMYKDSNNRYWIGTFDAGLVCFNPATGQNEYYYPEHKSDKYRLSGASVWGIAEDKNDKSVWIATSGGVSRIFEDGSMKNYFSDPADPTTLSQSEIFGLFIDSKNTVWFASFSGVDIYDRETDGFIKFNNVVSESNRLKTNRILSVFEDSKGFMWFATMGEGVAKFDPITGTMIHLTDREGLSHNTVYNIVEDFDGNLWVTTNQGVSKINPENFNIWNFDVRDGVQGHEFNLGAAIILSSGEVMFGGMNGFNIFNPSLLQENLYNPNIFITKFSVYNDKRSDLLLNNSQIELEWWENYFSFEFAALDFANPKKINYAYTLEGFDNEWSYVASDKRYADYTNIPPGKYNFRVKGTNSDGLWSSNELIVSITIKAPFWKTLWFKIISALVITFLIWYTVYSQVNKIRKKQEIERRMFEFEKNVFDLEQKILHLQMNPHFLFNALNSIQSFIMKNEVDNAVSYLSKFSNLMRLILFTSRSANVVLGDEMKLLQYYLEIESLRFDFIFKFKIHCDSEIEEEFTAIPSHMVQPLVENSIKHGLIHKQSDGLVEVLFKQKDEYIEIIIEDNGIGRESARIIQEKNKLGISNQGVNITQERLSILNRKYNTSVFCLFYEDIFDQDGKICGTRAVLRVPFEDV